MKILILKFFLILYINLFLIKKFISFFVICILHYIYIYIFLNLIVFKKYFENKFYHSY